MGNSKQSTVIIILAAVFSGFAGNVITAFGPSILSWGTKPSFTDTEIYKKISSNYPNIEDSLKKLLSTRKSYNEHREIVLVFDSIQHDKLILLATQTTEVVNLYDDPLDFALESTILEDTQLIQAEMTFHDGETRVYDQSDLHNYSTHSPRGHKKIRIPHKIPPRKSVKLKTQYKMYKSLNGFEPFITNRMIFNFFHLSVTVKPELQNKVKIDHLNLSFRELLAIENGPNNTTKFKLKGPVFPGQGIGVSWQTEI